MSIFNYLRRVAFEAVRAGIHDAIGISDEEAAACMRDNQTANGNGRDETTANSSGADSTLKLPELQETRRGKPRKDLT